MIAQPLEAPIHLRAVSVKENKKAGGNKIKFVNPNTGNYGKNLDYALDLHKKGVDTIERGMIKEDQQVLVVGSGPSLKTPEVLEEIRQQKDKGAIIFACKQAIKYLYDQGIAMDYGVTMDPGAHIARPEKIYKAPGLTHIVASSSDILLWRYFYAGMPFKDWIESLTENEQKRVLDYDEKKPTDDYREWKAGRLELKDAGDDTAKTLIFHSATGYEHEVEMYDKFRTSKCMGGGYNVVNRALSAAIFMGATNIIMAGTDCGWRKDSKFYVDETNNRPGVDMCDNGLVENTDNEGKKIDNPDGREWHTRPDMLASGVALAKLANKSDGKIVFIGDTLPSKLINKTDAFLNQCANFQK